MSSSASSASLSQASRVGQSNSSQSAYREISTEWLRLPNPAAICGHEPCEMSRAIPARIAQWCQDFVTPSGRGQTI